MKLAFSNSPRSIIGYIKSFAYAHSSSAPRRSCEVFPNFIHFCVSKLTCSVCTYRSLNVPPVFSFDRMPSANSGHTKPSSYLRNCHSGFAVKLSHCGHILVCKLGVVNARTLLFGDELKALSFNRILDISLWSSCIKMFRIAAGRIIAFVTDIRSGRNFPIGQSECCNVSRASRTSSTPRKLRVIAFVRLIPVPAFIRRSNNNLRPKSLFRRNHVFAFNVRDFSSCFVRKRMQSMSLFKSLAILLSALIGPCSHKMYINKLTSVPQHHL